MSTSDMQAPAEVPTEPRKRYNGLAVIDECDRTVGQQIFKHLTLENGTQIDLLDQQYRTEVYVSYPPTK